MQTSALPGYLMYASAQRLMQSCEIWHADRPRNGILRVNLPDLLTTYRQSRMALYTFDCCCCHYYFTLDNRDPEGALKIRRKIYKKVGYV